MSPISSGRPNVTVWCGSMMGITVPATPCVASPNFGTLDGQSSPWLSMTGSNTIVLISGANRGLGRGLLGKHLAQRNHIMIAAHRAPSPTTAKELQDLPAGPGSKVVTVKLDASVAEDAFNAVREIRLEPRQQSQMGGREKSKMAGSATRSTRH
ncbi:hypothetical protein AC578_5776 [Pseudocercospora eumusae]|uniref:Ketoreductase (KR) domain-containing protein n=1 Tax=Pseudocercospora eumusae TaxID=321146 RepID=A0A139H5E5_9PEZI|nr:hypothetical protein AC578_5776 [Pseudocercospora eumusae]